MHSRIPVFVIGALVCLACGKSEVPRQASLPVVTDESSERQPREEQPRNIYYNLTDYGWYARAEPIVLAHRQYGPSGGPAPIPLAKLRLSGNYQGVDYYVMHGEREPPATIYVPVYDGYWLPFVARPSIGD